MQRFESAPPLAHKQRREPLAVDRPPRQPVVLEHDVGALENSDREGLHPVCVYGFEEAGEEGGADDLVFDGFGVGEPGGG